MSLQAQNITVRIDQNTLVDDVSLTLNAGEILTVIGSNGAGKSTLLKAICGDVPYQYGQVTLDDKPINAWHKREVAKRRAVLPQSSTLGFAFTALEVTLMGRTPHVKGTESARDFEIAREALAVAKVSHLESRTYTTLSGGERQRVQLARVLSQIWEGDGERYLLLDEPTNNLDLAHQHVTLDIARWFAQNGVGVLAILHDLNLASQYADRILVMKNGRRIAEGEPHHVLTPEIIRQAFDVPVMIQAHPCMNCPLVIPVPVNQLMSDSQFEYQGVV